jgi:hypothetical protein
MKIFLAGGEGLTAKRQEALFQAGCRHRLTSFFSGKSMERVLTAVENFENSQAVSETQKVDKNDSEQG